MDLLVADFPGRRSLDVETLVCGVPIKDSQHGQEPLVTALLRLCTTMVSGLKHPVELALHLVGAIRRVDPQQPRVVRQCGRTLLVNAAEDVARRLPHFEEGLVVGGVDLVPPVMRQRVDVDPRNLRCRTCLPTAVATASSCSCGRRGPTHAARAVLLWPQGHTGVQEKALSFSTKAESAEPPEAQGMDHSARSLPSAP